MLRTPAKRVLKALHGGSSCPVLVETDSGLLVAKLRGAPQGIAALVAEAVTSELAERLLLPVPERLLVEFPAHIESDNRRDELLDLLHASVGTNLGFRFLEGARQFDPKTIDQVDPDFAARVLLLDNLTMNVDRTAQNPNLLNYRGGIWLIDHGASLPFAHWWSQVEESSPAEQFPIEGHLFWAFRDRAQTLVKELEEALSRESLRDALTRVPDALLVDLPLEPTLERTRQAYASFLLKRARALHALF